MYIFIYLFIIREPTLVTRHRGRNPASIPAIDTLIGEEEQKNRGKKKREQRNREWNSNPATLDPSFASYDSLGPCD